MFVDKDGHYTQALSKGWTPKNEAIKLAWNKIHENAEKVRQQVLAGKLSPIAYYMELNIMDISLLASLCGITKTKSKKTHSHEGI